MSNKSATADKEAKSSKTVAEAAQELRKDISSYGYYRSDNYTKVFGDPRVSVEMKTDATTSAAYSRSKRMA